ncbi:hypothetical protein ACHAXR_004518 [Thalassiosira sp. AJA248-18]
MRAPCSQDAIGKKAKGQGPRLLSGEQMNKKYRRHRRSMFPPLKLLIVAAIYSTAPFLSVTVRAFSPEILNQVIVQLGSFDELSELAFAAANLLDGPMSQQRKNNIPLLKLPPKNYGRNIISGVGSIQLPKLLSPSVYIEDGTVPGRLDLTPQEEQLIKLIMKVREKYSPSTTIRIAGGWVRDKLIYGKETPSRDIDLVLSDASGKEFSEKVCKYAKEMSDDEGVNFQIQEPSSSSKGIQADHLQNANLVINTFDVDFCRLRYEKYDKNSRIPSNIGVASAAEDAWRRDLTINALYYNINTNQVEDWTERGLRDLILQKIDTPKKAFPTLIQDPSRILRAIRFAAQLSFDMSPDLIRAANDNRVKDALQQKVSRDAIGNAIDEMFGRRCRDPARGIRLLMDTNLIDVVFPLGGLDDMIIYNVGLKSLSRTQSLITRIFLQSPDSDRGFQRRLLWYAAFFKPVYERMSTANNSNSKRSRRQESELYQLLDAMKRPKADMQSIETILKGVGPLQKVTVAGLNYTSTSPGKDLSELRWIIYSNLNPIGTMWKEALVLSLASSQKTVSECVYQYTTLTSLIGETLHLGPILLDKDKPRPLLNGNQIQQTLNGQIEGREFKQISQAMKEWQIRNVFCDLDSVDDDDDDEKRNQIEAEFVDYLVAAFPQYANCTQSSKDDDG